MILVLSDGTEVEVPDNATDADLQRIALRYARARPKKIAPALRPPAVKEAEKKLFSPRFGFTDVAGDAMALGLFSALDPDFKRKRQAYAQENPVSNVVAGITGAAFVPNVSAVARALGARNVGRALAARPIVDATVSGASQAGLTSALEGNTGEKLLLDTGVGGVLGGAISGGVKGVQALARALIPGANAVRRKAVDYLTNIVPETDLRAAAQRTVRANQRGVGVQQSVADQNTDLQAVYGSLAAQPGSSGTITQFERGRQRSLGPTITDLASRYIAPDNVAPDIKNSLRTVRQAQGAQDYEALYSRPFQATPEIQNIFTRDTKLARQALNNAIELVTEETQDRAAPFILGLPRMAADGSVTFDRAPSLQTLDYYKRGLQSVINDPANVGTRSAYRRGADKLLSELHDEVAKQAPEYRQVLATQRGLFQKEAAVDFGEQLVQRLNRTDTAVLQKETQDFIAKLDDPGDIRYVRSGIASAIRNAETTGGQNPVIALRKAFDTPQQRAVLDLVFPTRKDKVNLARFFREGENAAAAARTGRRAGVSPKGDFTNSVTSVNQAFGNDVNQAASALGVLSGIGTGRPGIAAVSGLRLLRKSGPDPELNGEIARLLTDPASIGPSIDRVRLKNAQINDRYDAIARLLGRAGVGIYNQEGIR